MNIYTFRRAERLRKLSMNGHLRFLRLVPFSLFFLSGAYRCYSQEPAISEHEIKPAVVIAGYSRDDSNDACWRIASPLELEKCWIKYVAASKWLETAESFKVDFNKYIVLGLFLEPRGYTTGVNILSVYDAKDSVRLRFFRQSPQALVQGERDAGNNEERTSAYAFVVLPHTDKRIIVEEGFRREGIKGGELLWRRYMAVGSAEGEYKP